MNRSFDRNRWRIMRPGLEAIRDVSWVRHLENTPTPSGRDPGLEDRALRKVADHPALAQFGPRTTDGSGLLRGKWLTSRALSVADEILRDLPRRGPQEARPPDEAALLLWATALTSGYRPQQLAARLKGMLPGRNDKDNSAAAVARVRSTMWLPGNHPKVSAEPGISRLYEEMLIAFRSGENSGFALDDAEFEYEWSRLLREQPSGGYQLLLLLTHLAPDTEIGFDALGRGWEPLPSPLRRAARDQLVNRTIAQDLVHAGLLYELGEGIACSAVMQQRIAALLAHEDRAAAVSVAIRFLRAALPPATHFYDTWKTWRKAEAHVRAAVAGAVGLGVRTDYAAHLCDRLSVYLRETNRVPQALEASLQAISISETDASTDPVDHATYVANYAMALQHASRFEEAVKAMDRALNIERESVGEDHEEYAESLNVKANILNAWGYHVEADKAHALALETINKIVSRNHGSQILQTRREIVNDYASSLLHRRASQEEIERAAHLLVEELAGSEQGGYGWYQLQFNMAQAARLQDNPEHAEGILRALVPFCEEKYGDSSQLLQVLIELSEVLKELQRADYDEVYIRAHELDDLLGIERALYRGPNQVQTGA